MRNSIIDRSRDFEVWGHYESLPLVNFFNFVGNPEGYRDIP